MRSQLLKVVVLALLCLEIDIHAATRTWDGGGGNNNWTTAANWDAAVAPGDNLIFPGGAGVDATSLNNTNDFAASTTFGSITISGTNYTLRGSTIVLTNGINHTSGGTNTVELGLTIDSVQTFAIAGTLNVAAAIGGDGGLTKSNPGILIFSGSSPNAYAGTTTVNGGTLLLDKIAGIAAIPNALVIGDGVGGANADIVRIEANSQIDDSSAVTINSSGQLDANGFTEVVGPVSGTGNLQLGTSIFSVGFLGSDVTFSGTISGSGTMIRNGTGAWILNGVNTFSGNVTVNATLLVNGTLPANMINVPGTLGGTGTVGRVTMSTTSMISPGLSPGRLTTSNVTFSASSTYRVELNGTTAGSGYDQLKVNGTINLASSLLMVTLGFPSAISNIFTIIDNDGADAVANTFVGLAEGATVNVNGTPFRISYVGGTGNDVTLTQLTDAQLPLLAIARASANSVVLSWGTNFTGYTLEAKTNLNTNVWAVVSPSPVVSGTNYAVTNAINGSEKFYRLRAP